MKLSTRRRSLITNGILAVALLGGAVLAYSALGTGGSSADALVRTVTAARGTVEASVSASGAVESAQSRSLAFASAGTVEKIYVKAGDTVSKGQILARLDDDAAQESLSSASAAYEAAADDGTSTAALYASYVKARNAYSAARREVAGTVLKAPFAGTVTAVNGSVGGSSATAGAGQGEEASSGFITVANTRKLKLVGSFTESDVTKLKIGRPATITFDALSGVTATGKITQIEPVAATSENVVQYPVTISFTKVPDEVRLGQTATVQVVTDRAEDVVTVPSVAVTTAGGQSTVTLLKDGRQVRTPVEIGVKGTATTEIRSGVAEGDTLVPPAATGTGGTQQLGRFPGGGMIGGPGGGPGGGR
ncbi:MULTISPECIES: efflux RND transporter periplasmic adaptor subunit [Nonomuraea]|uniref:Efflux RND transporter periplasmic adaptor subunit n=1 Tax=Nonomuraea mangrovi TaxID=2316207 RepID=A0ABW4T3H6_9ACTN